MFLRRLAPWILLTVLAGCGPASLPISAGIDMVSIPVMGRTPGDAVVSLVTGRDCSVVHLGNHEPWCHPQEQPPEPPMFCTRSLGVPDCWADRKPPAGVTREIADGPRTLTPEQDADRTKRWPGLW
jgi:hypothetical protein